MMMSEVGSAKSYNLSARKLMVAIYTGDSIPAYDSGAWISDFPGDADPMSIENIDIGRYELDINGEPYRVGKLPKYEVSLALIPGSEDERKLLMNLMMQEFENDDNGDLVIRTDTSALKIELNMVGQYNNAGVQVELTKGCLIGMSPGFTASADGKIATHIYNFSFRNCRWGKM